ncbi:zinc finger protein 808-like [Phlebotomus argentipes]|uniref:zinc finger protein 808-like n=1 Tax=Phlebotomus argentipes TaxID=94469 RepID=UPI0028931923|nr:zinc finger protein 808-like [Phlebotomus argentipes]
MNRVRKEESDYNYDTEDCFIDCNIVKEEYELQEFRETVAQRTQTQRKIIVAPVSFEITEISEDSPRASENRVKKPKRPFRRLICNETLDKANVNRRTEELKRHNRTVHTFREKIKCPVCHEAYARQDNLSRHIKQFHSEVPNNQFLSPPLLYYCSVCKKMKGTTKEVDDCLENHELEKRRFTELAMPLTCHICGAICTSFTYNKHMSRHEKIVKSPKEHKTIQRLRGPPNGTAILAQNTKAFKCISKHQLTHKLANKHRQRKFTCATCGTKPDMPFTCTACQKIFFRISELIEHLRTKKETIYCDICQSILFLVGL